MNEVANASVTDAPKTPTTAGKGKVMLGVVIFLTITVFTLKMMSAAKGIHRNQTEQDITITTTEEVTVTIDSTKEFIEYAIEDQGLKYTLKAGGMTYSLPSSNGVVNASGNTYVFSLDPGQYKESAIVHLEFKRK